MRSIDDLSEPNINRSFGSSDKISLMDVDSISATLRIIADQCALQQRVTVTLADSSTLSGPRHPGWAKGGGLWWGKTIDLKAAYKQLLVRQGGRWCSVIAVWDPASSAARLYIQATLPFGASASVLHFNRVARALWFVGCTDYSLAWGNFYDDYPVVEPRITANSANLAAKGFMKILGFEVSEAAAKDLDFSEVFVALGVVFHMDQIHLGIASISNKPARVDLAIQAAQKVHDEGGAPRRELEALRGRLQYLEFQTFGRAGKMALRAFKDDGTGKQYKHFDDEEKKCLTWLVQWLKTSVPRNLVPNSLHRPLVLFTDGACEFEGHLKVTYGALLYDPVDGYCAAFGAEVPQSLSAEWAADGKKQLVGQAELLPILVSKRHWASRMLNRKVLCFVDNDSAKFACIKADSDSRSSREILQAINFEESRTQTWTWFTRVPSYSNAADLPSRLKLAETAARFGAAIEIANCPFSLLGGRWH